MLTRNLNLCTMVPEDDELGGGGDGGEQEPPAASGEAESPAAEPVDDDGLGDLFGDPAEGDDALAGAAADADTTKNPAVNAVLDKIRETLPKGLHSLIIEEHLAPELTKMQAGWDAEMAKMQPWRDLEKHGVSAEEAVDAMRVAVFVRDNPDQALKEIAQLVQGRGLNPAEILGIQVAQAAAAAGDAPAGAAPDPDLAALLGDPDENPALKAILEKVTGLEQAQKTDRETTQRQQEEARQQQEQQEIAAAMTRLKAGFEKRGVHLNENAVLQYSVGYVNSLPAAQRETLDAFEVLKAGASAWMKDVQQAGQQLQRRAPRIGGGRGGIGTAGAPDAPEAPKTIEARKAKFLADVAAGKVGGSDDS